MRLSTQNILGLVALYLTLVIGFAIWQRRAVADAEETAMEQTAQLVGREIAVAMSESTQGQLLSADPEARMRLLRVLRGVAKSSEVVSGIAVVGPDGKVLASDNFVDTGRRLETPATVFASGLEPRLRPSDSSTGGGAWQLLVPLARGGGAQGYVQIGLAGQQLGDLYARSTRRLGMAALGGLLLVAILGLAFQLLLARRSEAVVTVLEGAIAGRETPVPRGRDEFSLALEAAGRVGRELQAAREVGAQARQRLNSLSLVLDVGVLLLGPARQIEFANARAAEVLGWADPAELERRWPEVRPLLEPALARAGERAASVRADIEVEGGSGPRRVRCQVYRMAEGGSDAFLLLLRDRTMLDALETDLLLASQLRGLTRIYRAITHDLRAPLNSMVMNLELLQHSLATAPRPAAAEDGGALQYVGVLREEIERLNRSLEALLAETAPVGAASQEFDVRDVLADLERLLRPQARLQGVTLSAELPAAPVRIAGQRDRLKQAVLNVVINALEAMPGGGTLALRLETRDGRADLAVSDSGPGIPEALRSHIFDMHFTTKTSGTGIGLYVARSIVEAHGGEIGVESRAGQGSEFHLRLPLVASGG